MNLRKILLVAVVALIAAGIVAAGIFLRNRAPAEGPDPTEGLPVGTLPLPGVGVGGGAGSDGLPEDEPGGNLPTPGFGPVSQAAVLDYEFTSDGELLTIDAGGAVISSSSSEPIIARANFGGLLGGWFSPGGGRLLVASGGSSSVRWSVLDIPTRTWKDLAVNTSRMSWSPDGRLLAYFAERTGGSSLNTIDPVTGNVRVRLSLSAPDLVLRWRGNDNILIMDPPSARVAGNVWGLSLGTGSLNVFAADVSGADALWGNESSGGLLFRAGPTGGVLTLVDERGNTSQVANFLTLPSKCAFGAGSGTANRILENYLFCAIPKNSDLLKSKQLPDDYLQREFVTADALYAVDLRSGGIFPLALGPTSFNFDGTNLSVHGEDLYFVNQNDRKLYRASLAAVIGLETVVPEE